MTAAANDLAAVLAAVLVDRCDDPRAVDRVDRALSDALCGLESLLDGAPDDDALHAAVGLAVGLLADARAGHLDRIACRVAAPLVVERLARAAGEGAIEAALAPVLALLGALAAVPDPPGRPSSAADPTPDPALPLEVAVAASIADPTQRSRLLDVLATATVHVPVLHGEVRDTHLALRLLPLVLRDGPVACAFTSASRLAEVAAEAGRGPVPTLELTGAELPLLWPAGHGLALNPGSVLGAVLTEGQVLALASRAPTG